MTSSSPPVVFPSFVTGALRVAPGSLPPGLADAPPAAEPLPAEFDSNTLLHMPRPVIAIAKNYPQGADTREHVHPRPQLLYAVDGLMRVSTDTALWLVPPQRALWIPAGVRHAVTMLTPVTMRSAYIESDAAPELGGDCQLLEVSRLLRELMLALTALPIVYPEPGRGSHLAALVLSEIEAADTVPIDIPWPRDRRLVAMCSAILADPGRRATTGLRQSERIHRDVPPCARQTAESLLRDTAWRGAGSRNLGLNAPAGRVGPAGERRRQGVGEHYVS
ncbi:AraC family ligand binding domain-containing protein [Chitinasiproducens palmae]